MGGQPVGEEVPLDAAEAGLLDIGLGKDRSGAAHQQQDQAGRVASSWASNASNPQPRELLGAAAVVWRVGGPPRAVSAILPSSLVKGYERGFRPELPHSPGHR